MALPARIVLIGFMGSGKTTVGRILAERLGRALVDTDALVVEKEGTSIAGLFAEKGEPAFRRAEAAVLAGLARRGGIVVASGGGAPAQPGNAWFFSADAVTFHLRVSFAAARQRTRADRGRPLMGQADEVVERLYESRRAVYERFGEGVETDGRAPEAVADEIMERLKAPRKPAPPGDDA